MENNQVKTAEELATEQREISVSEFFLRNAHLLGFDNPRKALLTTIKEGLDNALDATEEVNVLPDITIKVEDLNNDRFKVTMEDNGPGIVKEQIPKIFAKLLYGSKFHKYKQSRGQQGIGISAAAMYGQLTTGKAVKITSKTANNKRAHYYELHLNTKKNEPEIVKDDIVDFDKKHGTKIEIELEGSYQKGKQSIDEYLKQTAIVNPHLNLTYINPNKEIIRYPRATKELPIEAREIKPHPYGVELGTLISMLKDTKASTLQGFLKTDFARVSSQVAKKICEIAKLYVQARPNRIARHEADNLLKAIRSTKIMAPPTNCLSPIGEYLIKKGLKKEINADFYDAVTRPPSVYRGMPFQVEVAIAYGGDLPSDNLVRILRFANRVPLIYQQSAGASAKAIINTKWRNYGLTQSRGAIPSGPAVILVHIASVWVPFTSESKEAIAHYPEIIKEMKLALQEVGRKLARYVRKQRKQERDAEKKGYIEKYLPHIGIALKEILDLKDSQEKKVVENLKEVLEKSRT